jgi:hypothetical protein
LYRLIQSDIDLKVHIAKHTDCEVIIFMHERERVYYLTLTHDTSLRVEFVKVDILYKWLVLMHIIYATTKRFNCVFRA